MSAQVEVSKRIVPTLDSLSRGQVAAIRSIPSHENAVIVSAKASRPKSDFIDPTRFEQERAGIFKRLPVPVIPSIMLPEPNSVIAHDGYGMPIVLTRDKDGIARAFLNVCRHKGSKLVEDCEVHKASRLSCPYHAWTYTLNGKLVGLPRQETFLNVNKDDYGLVELHSREAGGLIWVILDRHAAPDFSTVVDELVQDLDAFGIGTSHAYGHRTFTVEANWKLVLEPFLEGYHVQRLHAGSIGQLFADVPNAIHRLGPHIRQVSGKAQFSPEMLDIPGENIHKTVTHAYLLFPNAVIVTSPYYISLMIVMPQSVGQSKVDYYMLTQSKPDSEKAEALYAKSYELIQKVFGTEDFRAAAISQVGLNSGALDELIYGGMEASIPEFYNSLEAYL